MWKRFGLLWLALLLSSEGLAAETQPVGSFKTVKGKVTLVGAAGETVVKVGTKIHQNDAVVTGPDASAGIIFQDNTRLSLGPNSRIVIDAYVFSPAKGDYSMVTRITRGTAEYISGKMGELSPEAVKFKTPSASLTIRGTHFLAQVTE